MSLLGSDLVMSADYAHEEAISQRSLILDAFMHVVDEKYACRLCGVDSAGQFITIKTCDDVLGKYKDWKPHLLKHGADWKQQVIAIGKDQRKALVKPKGRPKLGDRTSYSHYTLGQLVRALIVLKISSIRVLVNNSIPLLHIIETFFGKYIAYETIVKWTFFSQFCGGKDQQEIKGTMNYLRRFNIGSILDYAAEGDVAEKASPKANALESDVSMKSLLLRKDVQYQTNTDSWDACAHRAAKSVSHSSNNRRTPDGLAFIACKTTGFCDPQLLARVNSLMLYVRQTWVSVINKGRKVPKLYECIVIADECPRTGNDWTEIETRAFSNNLGAVFPDLSDQERNQVADALDYDKVGKITYYRFTRLVSDLVLTDSAEAGLAPLGKQMYHLTSKEKRFVSECLHRLAIVAKACQKHCVRMMIDAEQSFYQLAIDQLVRMLQLRFNREAPIVWGTYQAYLASMEERLRHDLARAHEQVYVFGAKLVRGAYMNQESLISTKYGYENPVCKSKTSTDRCFNNCGHMLIDEIEKFPERKPIGIMFGTHNMHSIAQLADRIRKMPQESVKEIAFAQLLGMGDHLTFPLARAGHQAFKYVPYGSVKETMNYLQRRAVENGDVLNLPGNERSLLWKEFTSRLEQGEGLGAIFFLLLCVILIVVIAFYYFQAP